MAVGRFDFFSECLKRSAEFRIILPNEADAAGEESEPMKLLVLLHGYTENSGAWLWNSPIVDVAQRYHLCVVLPTGENSFYLDGEATGRQHAAYVGQELVRYVRKTFGLSCRREDTFIGGLSMGGFGAIHMALQFSDTFAGAMALSSALITYELAAMQPGNGNGVANYEYYRLMFGDPARVRESGADPEKLVLDAIAAGTPLPRFYLACGEQDFLLEPNRRFERFLTEQKVGHVYTEGPGGHDFSYWRRHLEPGVRWLLGLA